MPPSSDYSRYQLSQAALRDCRVLMGMASPVSSAKLFYWPPGCLRHVLDVYFALLAWGTNSGLEKPATVGSGHALPSGWQAGGRSVGSVGRSE